MFNQSFDDRLTSWSQHRNRLETCHEPFNEVIEFWKQAPFIPYNPKVDPFYPKSWPTPWEIILNNKYDDFTKAIMMGYSLKYTKKFNNSVILIKTLVDLNKNKYYNVVSVDDKHIINYNDDCVVSADSIPESFLVENVVELKSSR
jgi:hypothetical protein